MILTIGEDSFITVQIEEGQRPDRAWYVRFEIISSKSGDKHRFIVKDYACPGKERYFGCARPSQDNNVPVAPEVNEDGESRIHVAEFILDTPAQIEEAKTGVLDDLDEYIRSKRVQDTLVPGEEFEFS